MIPGMWILVIVAVVVAALMVRDIAREVRGK